MQPLDVHSIFEKIKVKMVNGYCLFVKLIPCCFSFLKKGLYLLFEKKFHFAGELNFEFLKNHVTTGRFRQQVSLYFLKYCRLCQKCKTVQEFFLKDFRNVWETGVTWSGKKQTLLKDIKIDLGSPHPLGRLELK